jgi:hypothetical protein
MYKLRQNDLLVYILGDSLAKLSGHPDWKEPAERGTSFKTSFPPARDGQVFPGRKLDFIRYIFSTL